MARNWYVVLHRESDAATVLRQHVVAEHGGHPTLLCSSVDSSSTHYLALQLSPMTKDPWDNAEAWVPHHAVVAVMGVEPDHERSIGFVQPAAKPAA